jgi:hypothetical protein
MQGKPTSPFAGIRPALVDETCGVYSWLCQPAGMINRFSAGMCLTAEAARFVTEDVDGLMQATFGVPRRFVYIHDFSLASSYDTAARKILTDWGIARQRAGLVASVHIVPPALNPLFKMGIHTATAVLRVVGMQVEVERDLDGIVERLHLGPAL